MIEIRIHIFLFWLRGISGLTSEVVFLIIVSLTAFLLLKTSLFVLFNCELNLFRLKNIYI